MAKKDASPVPVAHNSDDDEIAQDAIEDRADRIAEEIASAAPTQPRLPPGVTMDEPRRFSASDDPAAPPAGWIGSYSRCGGCGAFLGRADRCSACSSAAQPNVLQQVTELLRGERDAPVR